MRILTKIANALQRLLYLFLIDEYNIDTVSIKDSTKYNSNKR